MHTTFEQKREARKGKEAFEKPFSLLTFFLIFAHGGGANIIANLTANFRTEIFRIFREKDMDVLKNSQLANLLQALLCLA